MEADRVVHTLDGSWNELWTGTTQTRLLEFRHGHLIYTTPETLDPMNGMLCTYRVEFERFPHEGKVWHVLSGGDG